jgi:ribosomal protein S12 methylthiotransferase
MDKIALISLGCAKNLVDSEVMLGLLEKKKYRFVSRTEEADIIIINTCGFIEPARRESLELIERCLLQKKKTNRKKIIVAGCFVQKSKENLKKSYPDVDGWLGVGDFDQILQVVEGKPFESSPNCFLYDHTFPRLISTLPGWVYVKISEGCSHSCSFCSIPLIKGPYRSRSVSSIVREVEGLVSTGIKEINLISQDSTYYGQDRNEKDGLAQLLSGILTIKNLRWLRILYGYPEEVTDSLLDIMKEEKICSYLDIPFQHSHPAIVRRMNRGFDGKRSLKLLDKIRAKIPDIAIRTSLIVGFPGERKQEFDDLKEFVTHARFDHLGVFGYSREKGTGCYDLGNTVTEKIIQRRIKTIMEIQADISHEINEKYLDQKIDVLIEGTLKQEPDLLIGRGRFQAPEVDGMVCITSKTERPEVFNSIQKVEITDVDVYDLYGKLIR